MSQSYMEKKARALEMLQKRKQNSQAPQSQVQVEEEKEEQKQPFPQQQQNNIRMREGMFIIQEENQNDLSIDLERDVHLQLQKFPSQTNIEEEEDGYILPRDELNSLSGQNRQQNIFNIEQNQNQKKGNTLEILYEQAEFKQQIQNPFLSFLQNQINPNAQQQAQQQQQGFVTQFGLSRDQVQGDNNQLQFVQKQQNSFFTNLFQQGQPQPQTQAQTSSSQQIGIQLDINSNQQLFNTNSNNYNNNNNNSNNFFAQLFQNNQNNNQNNTKQPRQHIMYNAETVLRCQPQFKTNPVETQLQEIKELKFNPYVSGTVLEINQDYFYEPKKQTVQTNNSFFGFR